MARFGRHELSSHFRRLWPAAVLVLSIGIAAAVWFLREPPAAWLSRARHAALRRDFSAAQDDLTRYLSAEPNSPEARLLAAQVARRAGYLNEALVQLDVAEALHAPPDAISLERALVEVQEGNLAHEAALWKWANADAEAAPMILEGLARGYRKNYLLDDMQAALTALLQLLPQDADALLDRAWIFERRVNLVKALEDCQAAVRVAPAHDEARLRLGHLLLLMEKPAEAEEALAPLRARRPHDPRVALGVFQACRKLGKTDEASRLERELAAKHPKELPILLERGRFLMEQGDAAAAQVALRAAAEQAPFDYQVQYLLHLCLRQLGRTEEADAQHARVQQLDADIKQMSELTEKLQKARFDPDIRLAIGKIFLRNGEEQEGLAWLKTVLRLHPQHAATRQALADYYEQRRQAALAEQRRNPDGGKTAAPPP